MTATRSTQDRLDEIGTAAAKTLRAQRVRLAVLEAFRNYSDALIVYPIVLLGSYVFAVITDRTFSRSASEVLVFMLTAAIAFMLFAIVRTRFRSVAAQDGLARLDHELGLEGRLSAAHEFGRRAERDGFMLAAIADAESSLPRAAAHRLAPDPRVRWQARLLQTPLFVFLVCALITLLHHEPTPGLDLESGTERTVAQAPATPRDEVETPRREPPAAKPPNAVEPKPRESADATHGAERSASREPERDARESTGKTGEGATTNATPTSSSSDSRGFVSSQTEPTEAGAPGKQPSKPAKPKPPETNVPSEKKKLEESGSTAGKGTGSGSSKNPGSTPWQSKDQVSADEEQPLSDDEAVDDETDESEARGGLQPSLRDRRPAVNRDLQIAFGNRPNPDANGRGGPSEQKKSRGVASLVLGVPIPDHVKGQPNPGRTKITQERVLPRADDAAPIDSTPRSAREQPIGPLVRRELAPWMRALVRSYFTQIRTKSTKTGS